VPPLLMPPWLHAGVPTVSWSPTLLAWNRTSDAYKGVAMPLHLEARTAPLLS
jgi:hypothetical protein